MAGRQAGSQSVSQSVSQPANRSTNQPAKLLVRRALLTVPFAASWQSMQELSSLGRFSVQVLRVRLYSSARNLVSLPGTGTQGRRRKSAKARRMEAKRGSKKKKEQERERERERGGGGGGRSKLLDRELVACSSKKNWKSAAVDGSGDPWGDQGREPWGTQDPPSPCFPPRSFPPVPFDKKESLTASDNLASRSSPRRPVPRPHTDRPRDMTRLFLR